MWTGNVPNMFWYASLIRISVSTRANCIKLSWQIVFSGSNCGIKSSVLYPKVSVLVSICTESWERRKDTDGFRLYLFCLQGNQHKGLWGSSIKWCHRTDAKQGPEGCSHVVCSIHLSGCSFSWGYLAEVRIAGNTFSRIIWLWIFITQLEFPSGYMGK